MHFRLYVTFDKKNARSSKAAREWVSSFLANDSSFCGDGGRFGSARADWFVIGGRWSGQIQLALSKSDFYGVVKKKFSGHEFGLTMEETKKNAKEIQKIWKDMGFKGKDPFARDSYANLGCVDDAMLVTKEIYEKILKEYEGQDEEEGFVDLDFNMCSKDFIGTKWIVVVDYHN